MAPSFGALLCLKVLWTWGDEEKWTPFEGFDYWGRKCSCTLALFFFVFPLCFPPGANLSGCSILELEWRWHRRIEKIISFCGKGGNRKKRKSKWSLWIRWLKRSLSLSCWPESLLYSLCEAFFFQPRLSKVTVFKCFLLMNASTFPRSWYCTNFKKQYQIYGHIHRFWSQSLIYILKGENAPRQKKR